MIKCILCTYFDNVLRNKIWLHIIIKEFSLYTKRSKLLCFINYWICSIRYILRNYINIAHRCTIIIRYVYTYWENCTRPYVQIRQKLTAIEFINDASNNSIYAKLLLKQFYTLLSIRFSPIKIYFHRCFTFGAICSAQYEFRCRLHLTTNNIPTRSIAMTAAPRRRYYAGK